MDWKKKVFDNFRLYAVTNLETASSAIFDTIEAAYQGGVDIVKLRSKALADAVLLRLGLRIKTIAEKNRKLFFVNDRIDIAIATGADGVHLGQEDMPVSVARELTKRLPQRFWVGKSTHTLKEAIAAVREGADYIGVGPVFMTPTKPHVKSVGLQFVKQAARKIQIPWVAIGGINLGNIRDVMASGATRVAVVRAIFAVKNPRNAARELKHQLEGI